MQGASLGKLDDADRKELFLKVTLSLSVNVELTKEELSLQDDASARGFRNDVSLQSLV